MRGKPVHFILFNFSQSLLRTAPGSPQLIVTRVYGDLHEPGFERGSMRSMISIESKIGLGETVLNNLFDLLSLRKEATGDASNLTAVPFEQLLKRRFFTRDDGSNQRVICHLFE